MIAIVNPAAGAGHCRSRWHSFVAFLQRRTHQFSHDFKIETRWTESPGDAMDLASRAVSQRPDLILAVGGDGTVHEVINGLLRASEPSTVPVPIGILPFGRGNDYADMLRIPRRIPDLFNLLQQSTFASFDVGVVECFNTAGQRTVQYFNNILGLGFDARVAARMNRLNRRLPWAIAYPINILRELTNLHFYPMNVIINGQTLELTSFLFVIAIGKSFGGGLRVAPNADPQDGRFDVIWADPIPRHQVIRLLPRVYRGRHLTHPTIHAGTATEITINSETAVPIEAEGEVIGWTPAHITIQPRRLTVCVPSNLS